MTRSIQLPTSTEIDKARIKLAAEIEKAKASAILEKAKLDWNARQWDLSDLAERSSPAEANLLALIRPINTKERYSKVWADLLCTLILWLIEEKSDVGATWSSSTLKQ